MFPRTNLVKFQTPEGHKPLIFQKIQQTCYVMTCLYIHLYTIVPIKWGYVGKWAARQRSALLECCFLVYWITFAGFCCLVIQILLIHQRQDIDLKSLLQYSAEQQVACWAHVCWMCDTHTFVLPVTWKAAFAGFYSSVQIPKTHRNRQIWGKKERKTKYNCYFILAMFSSNFGPRQPLELKINSMNPEAKTSAASAFPMAENS